MDEEKNKKTCTMQKKKRKTYRVVDAKSLGGREGGRREGGRREGGRREGGRREGGIDNSAPEGEIGREIRSLTALVAQIKKGAKS